MSPNNRQQSAGRPSAIIVATTFPARAGDGTPEFVLTLARSLRAFDVRVVVPRTPGAPRAEVIDGVAVRRVAYFPKRWEGLAADAIVPTLRAQPWRVAEIPFLFGALFLGTIREVRGRRRTSVVNAHWIVPAGVVALLAGLVTGVPYVVTVHGADAYALRGRFVGWLKRLVLRRATAVLPVSTDIARTLGVEEAPVLRMGVDTTAIRSQIGPRAPQDGLLVGIGRLADKKGFDVLLDALARLPDARLEIVGDGPDRGELEARADRLGIVGRVRFLGRQPRNGVLAALGRATVVVIPSKVGAGGDMEGTPVVLCEAMAAGVPIVASDLGGLGECLTDGVTGMLVPPGDVDALADTLHRVLAGQVDREALGRNAAEEAARSLDVTAIGHAYDRILIEALGTGSPTRPNTIENRPATNTGGPGGGRPGGDAVP